MAGVGSKLDTPIRATGHFRRFSPTNRQRLQKTAAYPGRYCRLSDSGLRDGRAGPKQAPKRPKSERQNRSFRPGNRTPSVRLGLAVPPRSTSDPTTRFAAQLLVAMDFARDRPRPGPAPRILPIFTILGSLHAYYSLVAIAPARRRNLSTATAREQV